MSSGIQTASSKRVSWRRRQDCLIILHLNSPCGHDVELHPSKETHRSCHEEAKIAPEFAPQAAANRRQRCISPRTRRGAIDASCAKKEHTVLPRTVLVVLLFASPAFAFDTTKLGQLGSIALD